MASLEPFDTIKRILAKAVLSFQDKFVELRVDSGSLVQVSPIIPASLSLRLERFLHTLPLLLTELLKLNMSSVRFLLLPFLEHCCCLRLSIYHRFGGCYLVSLGHNVCVMRSPCCALYKKNLCCFAKIRLFVLAGMVARVDRGCTDLPENQST